MSSNSNTLEDQNFTIKFEVLMAQVKGILSSAPGCHDWEHSLRVLRNARTLAQMEGIKDLKIIELAAVIHDIARPEEMTAKGKICHAERGAEVTPKNLHQCGFDDNKLIIAVAECVRRHRFRGNGPRPESIEEKIIYDADKLDCLGAVGIGRAFHFAGRVGAKLHNSVDEALGSEAYSLEDTAYREYLVKLRHVPEKMLTESGRSIGQARREYMDSFFKTMNIEVFEFNQP